jgi:DTW domain-containing protein YfiP
MQCYDWHRSEEKFMNPNCSHCLKPAVLCICADLQTLGLPAKNQLQVLILQHPQEPDKELGSAHLAHLALANSQLKIGLSWPNLSKALGGAAPLAAKAEPQRWATLYLGSGVKGGLEKNQALQPGLHFVTRQGNLAPQQPTSKDLDGIIILDGTWSQAKALWWRNAWLLKTRRAILQPSRKSLYQELRREPRRECLSTIETIAESLLALGEPTDTGEKLRGLFSALLQKKRANRRSKAPASAAPIESK